MSSVTKIIKLIRSGKFKNICRALVDAPGLIDEVNDVLVRTVVKATDTDDFRVRQGCLIYLQSLVRKHRRVALDAGLMKALGSIPEDDHDSLEEGVTVLHILVHEDPEIEDVPNAVTLLSRAIIQVVKPSVSLALLCKFAHMDLGVVIEKLHITEVCKYFWTQGPCVASSIVLASAMCGCVRYFGAEALNMDAAPHLLEMIGEQINVVYISWFVQQMCKSGYVDEMVDLLNALLGALDTDVDLVDSLGHQSFDHETFRRYVLSAFSHALEQSPGVVGFLRINDLLDVCTDGLDQYGLSIIYQLLDIHNQLYPHADNLVANELRARGFPHHLRLRAKELPLGDRVLNTWFPEFSRL